MPDPGLWPAVAELGLADHHCHGVIRRDLDRPAFEAMLTEADYADAAGVTMFGSQLGLALRRWCPPVLGLDPHTGPDEYLAARAGLGHEEVSRRVLRAAGLDVLYVDTGFEPEPLTSPAELAALAFRPAGTASGPPPPRPRCRWAGPGPGPGRPGRPRPT